MRCGVPAWALHPGRVCPCMHVLLYVLCLMMDPSWRGTADALWNMLEDDYNGEWLSLSLSSVCTSPLPLPPPLFCFLLLSHSAREVKCHPVSVVKAANHPHSECKATVAKETVIRLLGTWSCAHNSHFVAWKRACRHTSAHNHINSFAQSTSSSKFI